MSLFRRRPSHPAYCQVRPLGRACDRRTAWSVSGWRTGEGPEWSCEPCARRLEHSWGLIMVVRP
jgi:hypothetical protein